MSKEIIFKDWTDCFDMGELHPTIRPILELAVELAGQRLVITSVKRKTGVHGLLRALDVVPEDRDIEVMKKIRTGINKRWDYGRKPYQVVPKVRHGTAPHVHIQCRDQTRRRNHVS